MLIAFLPGQVIAEGHMAGKTMTAGQKAAAQKAKKRQMMMQMMKKKQAAEAARIPSTTAIYDPAGGETGRNLQRFDQASCLNWRGGPRGTLMPANMTASAVPPMPGTHGAIGVGYNSACDRSEVLVSFANRGDGFFARGMIYSEDNGSYDPPNGGATIANDSDRVAFSIGGGVFRPDGSFLSFDLRKLSRDEVRYPGLPIVTENLDVTRYDIAGKYVLGGGAINQLRFNAKFIDVEKLNNITINPMEVRVNRKTSDIDFALDGGGGDFKWTVGLSYASDNRDGGRYNSMNGMLTSPNFADATVAVTSLKANGVWALSADRRLKASAQLDHVKADLARMGAGAGSPAGLFLSTYGAGANVAATSETNFSAALRFEQDLSNKHGMFFAGLSRHVRTANPRERYFALYGPAAQSWAGNPRLNPEKHHMLEVGAGWKGGPWELAGRAYVDHVEDFILWDRAHGQAGVAVADNRNIFRNVDALITGVEASAKYKFAGGWWAGADLWLTHGENTTDNRPIGQIPAAEAALKLGWANQKFAFESRLRIVDAQNRLDANPMTGSGVDSTAPNSYAVLDVSGTWKPKPNMAISFGIDNLLDEEYTPHIERMDVASPGLANPMAPGRNLWIKATMRF